MEAISFKAPTVINLELTEACNLQCRHCYNFWRKDRNKSSSMSKDALMRLIDIFVEAGVFHVVLTGGEPMLKIDLLEFGIKEMLANNISVSCNSNLMLANSEKIKRLRDIGLDHILTSLNSYDPQTNDRLVGCKGAFEKITKNIEIAVKSGMRVSVNMIISQENKTHVYQTGRFVSQIGCQKIFGTRLVPPGKICDVDQSVFNMNKEESFNVLEQLIRIKEDAGIMIGTLVSYPLCFLGDLERYADFVGRGCPGQSGHLMSINANGDTHACVHQYDGYGNIFESGIYKTYRRMNLWHDRKYHYVGCKGCPYIEICNTGCRMFSLALHNTYDGQDPLMNDKRIFNKHYNIAYDPSVYEKIRLGIRFRVPDRLRFRKEDGFYLVNIRWANTIIAPNAIAEFLMKYKNSGREFLIDDFGRDKEEILAKLYFKDVIESKDLRYVDLQNRLGLHIDSFLMK